MSDNPINITMIDGKNDDKKISDVLGLLNRVIE